MDMDFIIAINKSDIKLQDGVTLEPIHETVNELGNRILGIHHISAGSEEGLEELKRKIVDVLIKQEDRPWENFE